VKEGVDLGALERRINKVVKKQAATHNMEIEMEMKG